MQSGKLLKYLVLWSSSENSGLLLAWISFGFHFLLEYCDDQDLPLTEGRHMDMVTLYVSLGDVMGSTLATMQEVWVLILL